MMMIIRRALPFHAASAYPCLLMNGNAWGPAGASRTCLNLHALPRWHPCGVLKNAQMPYIALAPGAPPVDLAAPRLAMSAGLDCTELRSACSEAASTPPGFTPSLGCPGGGGPGGPGGMCACIICRCRC